MLCPACFTLFGCPVCFGLYAGTPLVEPKPVVPDPLSDEDRRPGVVHRTRPDPVDQRRAVPPRDQE